MNKNLLKYLPILLVVCVAAVIVGVSLDYSFISSKYYSFKIVNGNAEITEYNGSKKNVTVPEHVERNNKEYTVTSIGEYAFWCCDVKKVEIPETVVSIGSYAFRGSTIQEIILPKTLKYIGSYTFSYCENLEYVVLSNTVETIGNEAFAKCDNLSIYCDFESVPNGFDESWNIDNNPVYLAGEWEYVSGVPQPIK